MAPPSTAVDPAILDALGLDASRTKMASHGGSGFSSTFKLTTTSTDGESTSYFVKTGASELMFRGSCAPGSPARSGPRR